MKFSYPDKDLEKASIYYLKFKDNKIKHNLFSLSFLKPEYLQIISPFSYDDDRYTLYPNNGWIENDYSQMLSLDLTKPEDKKEFRLLAANFARVIAYNPKLLLKFKEFPHFEQILEFVLIEGLYDYFNIDIETLLLKCVEYKVLSSGDCALITMSKTLIFKDYLQSLNIFEKLNFYIIKNINKFLK